MPPLYIIPDPLDDTQPWIYIEMLPPPQPLPREDIIIPLPVQETYKEMEQLLTEHTNPWYLFTRTGFRAGHWLFKHLKNVRILMHILHASHDVEASNLMNLLLNCVALKFIIFCFGCTLHIMQSFNTIITQH